MLATLHTRSVKNLRPSSGGFTLLELSIVIMIISMVLGGVVLGHSLIRNAELQSIAGEYEKYTRAIGQFRDKYRALPGDIHNGSTLWGASAGDGDGNGYIQIDHEEHFHAWQHLSKSGLIEGNYDGGTSASRGSYDRIPGTNIPASTLRGAGWGIIYVSYDDAIVATTSFLMYSGNDAPPNHVLWFGGRAITGGDNQMETLLTAEEAEQIDIKLDDGMPRSGKILSQYTPDAEDNCDASATTYNITATGVICSLIFKTGY